MDTRYLLVLTATVTPAANAAVKRKDPVQRLNDYLSSLEYWLECPDERLRSILFLENSGADLAPFRKLVETSNPYAKKVELISVPGNQIPPGVNYGYGEMEMLDQGLEHSSLRRTTTHMIKVTGRLRFPKLPAVLDRLPVRFSVAVECRHRPKSLMALERVLKSPNKSSPSGLWRTVRETFARQNPPWTSSQIMIFSHAFYDDHLRKAYREMRSPYPTLIENLICDKLIVFERSSDVVLRWPVNLEPVGFAGHAAKKFDSPKRALIRWIRSALRTFAPSVWF
jgi:hypothetical protein